MNKKEILKGFRLFGLETQEKRDEMTNKNLLHDFKDNKQSKKEVITDSNTHQKGRVHSA